jgi:glucose/arabinose dehydrogenase
MNFKYIIIVSLSFTLLSCKAKKEVVNNRPSDNDTLPLPYATKSVMNFSNVVGWRDGQTPKAPDGFTVQKYADGFENPRWLYVTSTGDILVAESNSNHPVAERIGAFLIGAHKSNNLNQSADRITLLRDTNNDGTPDVRSSFLSKLNQPFGMLVLGNWFYVANTDGLVRYPYETGQTKIAAKGEKIIDLPAGKHNRHWTRNIIANKDRSKIYIAVGSGSNVGEHGMEAELLKADILEVNPDGSELKVYASGLRNPVGMDWYPGSNTLWTVVNERDELGDNLVPDYLTHVEDGGFYGWPYVYFGNHVDPRVTHKPAIVRKTIVPDVALGSHTASLGLVFYSGNSFPKKYHEGAFVVQHGSWNRSILSGYKVMFVPFHNGKPAGQPEDFLTGFVHDLDNEKVYGRPVCAALLQDGSMLITDDVTNIIWRVSFNNKLTSER